MQTIPTKMRTAFEQWAQPLGYSLSTDGDDFIDKEARHAWLGFQAAYAPDGHEPESQQLYAHIKKTSDYAHQSDKLFPVWVGKAPYNDYVVHGGPGGVYRLSDVDFYVIGDGKQYKLK